ncbi:MAG: cytochrome c biogenesis protein CcdC [Bryobacterales bacterium]|nr:cytochrome c biogenesis protein CcdC [Bryobacterales bacterium]
MLSGTFAFPGVARALPFWAPAAGSTLGLFAVLAWRVHETSRAVSARKIVLPPLGMATGLAMFALRAFRVPWHWAGSALLLGAIVLAYPLVRTTRLERRGQDVILHRSKALFAVILGLAAIRFAARGYLDSILSTGQTASLAYLLAFGMIVRWRVQMLRDYRLLTSGREQTPAAP